MSDWTPGKNTSDAVESAGILIYWREGQDNHNSDWPPIESKIIRAFVAEADRRAKVSSNCCYVDAFLEEVDKILEEYPK